MSDDESQEVEPDELEEQDGEELPDRELMSVITPDPDGGITIPVEGDPGDRW